MAKLITAVFESRARAMQAVEDLGRHGCPDQDINLLMSDSNNGRAFVVNEATKAAESLSTGAAIGGIIGALVAGLSSAGMIATPSIDFIATGQGVAALAGCAVGLLSGGVIGGLIGLQVPEHRVEFFKGAASTQGILLGVYVLEQHRADEAVKILEANSATNIRTECVKARDNQKQPAAVA